MSRADMPSIIEAIEAAAAVEVQTVSPVMTTRADLERFVMAVEERMGDPAAACGLLCMPWVSLADGQDARMFAEPVGDKGDAIALTFPASADYLAGRETISLPMGIGLDEPDVHPVIGVMRFQAKKIAAGVWALSPSLNAEGLIHAFVVIHGVPDPAPWERRVVLA